MYPNGTPDPFDGPQDAAPEGSAAPQGTLGGFAPNPVPDPFDTSQYPAQGPHTRYADIPRPTQHWGPATYYGAPGPQTVANSTAQSITQVSVGGYGRRYCNHALHFVMSVLTCGLWTPIWAIDWAIKRGAHR